MQPDTSLAAYKAVTPEMLSDHHAKLISALRELGKATYEQLAKHIGWDDKNRASRRLKELESEQVVYKTGEKKLTSSGRNANVYALVTNGQTSVEPERVDKNTTTAADFANLIIAASGKRLVQKEMF
jgi:DNA-binding HxlR family transcriptional regulator